MCDPCLPAYAFKMCISHAKVYSFSTKNVSHTFGSSFAYLHQGIMQPILSVLLITTMHYVTVVVFVLKKCIAVTTVGRGVVSMNAVCVLISVILIVVISMRAALETNKSACRTLTLIL